MSKRIENILIIRLGALGDLVFCFQAFHEIRKAHPHAKIALLTRAPYAEMARHLPWFDQIIIDTHPRFTQIKAWMQLVQKIHAFAPTRVYDLQGKARQTILYALLGGPLGVEWSGAAPLCRFKRPKLYKGGPPQGMHFTGFLAAQLCQASVPQLAPADISWFDLGVEKFSLPERYVVLVPGSSPGAPHKRWPPQKFAEIANFLQDQNVGCVAVGTKADLDVCNKIKILAPHLINLCEQTSLLELAGILRRSLGVIGNDTGPTHLAAALGAPTLALFSGRSNPIWSKPPGKEVIVLQKPELSHLTTNEVVVAFNRLKEKTGPRDE